MRKMTGGGQAEINIATARQKSAPRPLARPRQSYITYNEGLRNSWLWGCHLPLTNRWNMRMCDEPEPRDKPKMGVKGQEGERGV